MKTLIFDTETTGIPKHPTAKRSVQPRMIEFAAVLVDSSLTVEESFHFLLNPGVPLEPIITKITGLTDEDLKPEPNFAELKEQIREPFFKADCMIAHNLPFDKEIVQLELDRAAITDWPFPARQICTVQEHFEEWGWRPKLINLYEHYMGKPLNQTHRALDDVEALMAVCIAAGVIAQ